MQGTRKSLFESKVETIHDIPVSTGEIREPDRHRAILKGDPAEFLDGAPFCRVIDILVKRKSVVQAVDQSVVHDEVHSAVAADSLGLFLYFLDEIELVGIQQRIHDRLWHIVVAVDGLDGDAGGRILVGKAFRSCQLVHPGVRTGSIDIVLDLDQFALAGTDEADGVVSVEAFSCTVSSSISSGETASSNS